MPGSSHSVWVHHKPPNMLSSCQVLLAKGLSAHMGALSASYNMCLLGEFFLQCFSCLKKNIILTNAHWLAETSQPIVWLLSNEELFNLLQASLCLSGRTQKLYRRERFIHSPRCFSRDVSSGCVRKKHRSIHLEKWYDFVPFCSTREMLRGLDEKNITWAVA